MTLSRRHVLASVFLLPSLARGALAEGWAAVAAEARGQTLYFNAWAGSESVNAYIAWAAGELKKRAGITLIHVKIADAAEVVRRVRDEVNAGAKGSVDLVWINGENFRAMKQGGLLFGPFAESLPNFRYVDTEGKPTTRIDFAEPVEGFEGPWGMAQLTFFGDGAKIPTPPRAMPQLFEFAKAHPGRVSYPAPPDFHGTTFIKQALLESITDRTLLSKEIGEAGFADAAEPLWDFLDRLNPYLWREGRQFPQSAAEITQMLADGELMMSITFNPNEPANLVAEGRLPATTIAWQHEKGTIGNTHFVAIPVNAQAKAAAQVTANFLLSPEAQARKADLKVWGDPTVLAMQKLSISEARQFAAGNIAGSVKDPAPALPEPHASWVPLIEAQWLLHYGL